MNMQVKRQSPVSLFNLARQRGQFHRLTNLFSKHAHTLLDLVDMIDFDHHFHPLTDRIRDRWFSVAKAREKNIPLDAVCLIRVGEFYFVADGHHRISVGALSARPL